MSTTAEKVAQYIRLRDYKKAADEEFKKSMERVNAAMRKLEAEFLQELIDMGVDHIGGETGTVYRKTDMTCTVQERDEYLDYVVAHQEWDALDVKANKTFIRQLIDEGKSLPPGVKVSTYETVGVRR